MTVASPELPFPVGEGHESHGEEGEGDTHYHIEGQGFIEENATYGDGGDGFGDAQDRGFGRTDEPGGGGETEQRHQGRENCESEQA